MSLTNDVLATDLTQLDQMYDLEAVLGRMIKNLQLIINGANGKIITVVNANLFVLAAQYYGDATKWTAIAEANNLSDPEITSDTPIQIVIPQTADASGGILGA